MASHLIYHPQRCVKTFGSTTVHYDRPRGNQDPYVWNDPFLHTFCHMPELTAPGAGDIQIWVSGDVFPAFNALYCDLVFTVGSVHNWATANAIAPTDPIVDTPAAYQDHYRWWTQHVYKKRTRRTLKADRTLSFQPQETGGALIDILPELTRNGYTMPQLRTALKKGFASKPMVLPAHIAASLRQYLHAHAINRLDGATLQALRAQIPTLSC